MKVILLRHAATYTVIWISSLTIFAEGQVVVFLSAPEPFLHLRLSHNFAKVNAFAAVTCHKYCRCQMLEKQKARRALCLL